MKRMLAFCLICMPGACLALPAGANPLLAAGATPGAPPPKELQRDTPPLQLPQPDAPQPCVLKPGAFRHYIDGFNRNDRELYAQYVPNAASWDFLRRNIPLLDCPDKEIEEIYYFRWWTFRKHIKQTPRCQGQTFNFQSSIHPLLRKCGPGTSSQIEN